MTEKEQRCYLLLQRLRRQALWRRLAQVQRIVWPEFLERMPWSEHGRSLMLQAMILIWVWPLIILWGAGCYLFWLIRFPHDYLLTHMVPAALRAPGEKTLLGLHHAFGGVTELSEADYFRCVDGWVALLFEPGKGRGKTLSQMVEQVSRQRQQMGVTDESGQGLRSAVSVAREQLSRELGHYLSTAKPVNREGKTLIKAGQC